MNLNTIRRRIDRIDGRILRLLRWRMALVLKTPSYKSGIPDTKREKQIIRRLGVSADDVIRRGFLRRLYRLILAESRRLQAEKTGNGGSRR